MSKSPNFLSLYLGLLVYFIQEPFNYWDKKREFRETPVLFCAILAFLFSAFAKSLSSFPASVAFSFCCADSEVKQTKRGAECLISKVTPAMRWGGGAVKTHTIPISSKKNFKNQLSLPSLPLHSVKCIQLIGNKYTYSFSLSVFTTFSINHEYT